MGSAARTKELSHPADRSGFNFAPVVRVRLADHTLPWSRGLWRRGGLHCGGSSRHANRRELDQH